MPRLPTVPSAKISHEGSIPTRGPTPFWGWPQRVPTKSVPRRDDIQKILLIGSGPIVIGQACEFDYSGTQACKALREEGYQVVLINSNPATIMTDPDMADRTYIEPLTWEMVAKVIEAERPDAIFPTLGGQTGSECRDGLGPSRRPGDNSASR